MIVCIYLDWIHNLVIALAESSDELSILLMVAEKSCHLI